MATHSDIIIIGAGFAGAATAWALRERGATDVLILEMEETPGVHSSGRNAGLVRELVGDPDNQILASEGAAILRKSTLTAFHQTGSLLIGQGNEDVQKHVPVATGSAQWCPADGVVEIDSLLQAYLENSRVEYGTRVLDILYTPNGAELSTSHGTVTCRIVVNASGPWAGEVGHIAVSPLNRHIFVTPPMPAIDPNWPFVWDIPEGFYFRPESGGLLLCACDETAAKPGHYPQDFAVLEKLFDLVNHLQPGLGDLSIMNQWVGQRTFANDRKFVIGFDPNHPALFHIAGLGGHGVTCSASAGRKAASFILDNEPQDNPFRVSRLLY